MGLMDTDGTATKGCFSFSTTSERLKEDFKWLCRSLGYQVRERLDHRPEQSPNSDGKCWSIAVLTNDVENLFKLQRKKDAFYEYRAKRKECLIFAEKREPKLLPADKAHGPMIPENFIECCSRSLNVSQSDIESRLSRYSIQFKSHPKRSDHLKEFFRPFRFPFQSTWKVRVFLHNGTKSARRAPVKCGRQPYSWIGKAPC